MTWAARIRARRYAAEIARRARETDEPADPRARRDIQLERLNEDWARTVATVPHYAALARAGDVPDRFASLEEFAATVPATARATIQELGASLASSAGGRTLVRMTGGSTAAPVRLPAWPSELVHGRPDAWVARGWYGITPASRLYHLWGHSHLLGSGWRGWVNARRREISDRLLGYLRVSAYDLRPAALRRAAEALVRFRPDYVMGYSVALDLLARAAEPLRDEIRQLGIRAVIGTAEGFPADDSQQRISSLFVCPVAMEYGAVETGIMAHTFPGKGYRVFWRSFLLEVDDAHGPARRLRVTTLYPRAMPLVRYAIGDEIELVEGAHGPSIGIHEFARVLGRVNDYVTLPDGMQIHSEAFSHAVRACASVRGYQVRQAGERIALVYTADADLAPSEEEGLRERLRRIHPTLDKIDVARVDSLPQTVAGKTPMVVRQP